ncbi:hypothetical protein [Hymenobacter jeollabukensis]|uniref:Uncharacterized protein n=1 Tax=Hymenobacter jeollabukensis TaxID=2025313 RepID=A0A5R8WVH0_9BACT|nr:hypothetical protein [Hymenobacter jeollabukensis]TLM96511.1 hypothetical protein FDY95_00495 [Hymenobacter jeollabukensis]
MSVTDTSLQSSSTDIGQKTLIAGFNATLLFILAYLTADTAYRLATVLMARQLHIPGVWELSRVKFLIADSSWWRQAVVAVYSVGPLVCLVLGVVAALWFWQRARLRRGLLKQYLLWLVLHCLNLFFGAMVADTITQSGFWYVPSWVFLAGNAVNVAVAVLSGLALLALGYLTAPLFLQSHDSRTLMRYGQRRRLLGATLFAPWLLGSALIGLAKYPDMSTSEWLHLATLVVALVPLAVGSSNELFEFTVDMPQKTRVASGLLVLVVLVLVLVRVVLGHGLHFG